MCITLIMKYLLSMQIKETHFYYYFVSLVISIKYILKPLKYVIKNSIITIYYTL